MRSPICHLFSAINSSPFKIAPEKEQDLKTIVDDKKIIISVVSELVLISESGRMRVIIHMK